MASKVTAEQSAEFHNLIESRIQENPCRWQTLVVSIIILIGGLIAGAVLVKYDYAFTGMAVQWGASGLFVLLTILGLYQSFQNCGITHQMSCFGKEPDLKLFDKIADYGLKHAGSVVKLKKEKESLSVFSGRQIEAREIALAAHEDHLNDQKEVRTIIRKLTDSQGRSFHLVGCTPFKTPGFAHRKNIVVNRELYALLPNSTFFFDQAFNTLLNPQGEYFNRNSHYHLLHIATKNKAHFLYSNDDTGWSKEWHALTVLHEQNQEVEIRDALLFSNYDSLCTLVQDDTGSAQDKIRHQLTARLLPKIQAALNQTPNAVFFVNATLIPLLERSFRKDGS